MSRNEAQFLQALPEVEGDIPPTRIMLLPVGKATCRDGRVFYNVHAEEVVMRSRDYAGNGDLVIDFEHQTDHSKANGQPSPAAGWIKALDATPEGIFADVEWTARARQMISAREYRYISPTLAADPQTGKVKMIYRAALTNSPALDMAALASAQHDSTDGSLRRQLAELFEIEGDDDEAILKAVRKLLKLASTQNSEDQNERLSTLAADLARAKMENDKYRIELKVEDAIKCGAILPSLRDWSIEFATANEEQFDHFIERMGKPYAYLQKPVITEKMEARLNAQIQADRFGTEDDADKIARSIGVDVEVLRKPR